VAGAGAQDSTAANVTLHIEREGPVLVVTMDRPAAKNAVDPEQAVRLRAAFSTFERQDEAKVAVLTGAGGTFCAGYDLKSLAGRGISDVYEPDGEGPMGPSRMVLSKPVIAAIEGHAVAGGLELALWCDLRVASETAIFGVFCRRWGVPLVDGGTVRLPRVVGMGRALDMILTGRAVAAREALEWGLANRLVPAAHARSEAVKLAREIARFPELCMRTDRASAYRQWDLELAAALRMEGREGLAPLLEGASEGAARFAGGKGRSGDFGEI
jgi:enoyl-CoA hydratase